MQKSTVRIGDIIFNYDYQLRKETPSFHIARYAEAMRSGHIFPEITIDSSTMEILDGFTRVKAYQTFKNPDMQIPAKFIKFKNEKEKFLFIADENSKHGNPYGTWEKKNIILQLTKNGASTNEISDVLGIAISKVKTYADIPLVTIGGRKAKGKKIKKIEVKKATKNNSSPKPFTALVKKEEVILKRGFEHLKGKKISEEQWSFIKESGWGWSETHVINYLMNLIDFKLYNPENLELYEKLQNKLNEII